MSDASVGIATGVAVGAISYPTLQAFGIDAPALVAGLGGAVAMQTILRDKTQSNGIMAVFILILGSSILASLFAPLLSEWLVPVDATQVFRQKAHVAIAATLGLFSRTILIQAEGFIEQRVAPFFSWIFDVLKRLRGGGTKEGGGDV